MILKKISGTVSSILAYTPHCFYKKVFDNDIIQAYHYNNFILVKNNNNFFSIFKTFCSTGGGALIVKVFDQRTLLMSFKEWVIPAVSANISNFSKCSTLEFFKNHMLSNRFMSIAQINKFNELVTNSGSTELAFIKFNEHRYLMDYLMFNIEIYYFASVTHISYSSQEIEGFQFSMMIKENDLLIEECEESVFKQSLIKEKFSKYTQGVNIDFMKSVNNHSLYCFYNESYYTGYIQVNEKTQVLSAVFYCHDTKESSYLHSNNLIQDFNRKIYEILHFFVLKKPSVYLTSLLISSSLSSTDIDTIDGMHLIEILDF